MGGDERRERLAGARLYFVCDSAPAGRPLGDLLDAALLGGVDVVQLRDKTADDAALLRAAATFRAAADSHQALFILNDRPDLVRPTAADGVHVGQEDEDLDAVRDAVGTDHLIGLSTHTPAQFDAGASGTADYLSAGPVHTTPTKPGRPATGLALIRHAAELDPKPWFAIGGIDSGTAGAVVAAGAARLVVVRAIRNAPDPLGAARELRTALGAKADVG